MKLPWQWKDYLFAAAMTLGMVISALVIPLVSPRWGLGEMILVQLRRMSS